MSGTRISALRRVGLVACMLGVAVATAAATPAPRLDIGFRLLPDFAGTDQVQGRIVVSVTNAGDQALHDVTLRMARPELGQLIGGVNEGIDLQPHETRSVEGRFQFDADSFDSAMSLTWHVLYRDDAGFVLQTKVVGRPGTVSLPVQALNRY